MTLDIQFIIKSNPLYKEYLRSHSFWYRILTRFPERIKIFEEEVKKNYKLTTADKINRAANALEMIQSFMSVIK